jgi:hypothetical protein
MWLGGRGRDLEIYANGVVVAADSGLLVVDAKDPADLVLERDVATCGRAVAVELVGDQAFFATPLGLGSVDISGADSLYPDRFSFLLPTWAEGWELIEMNDPSMCVPLSIMAEAACALFDCPADRRRPFDVDGGHVFISALRNVLIIGLSPGGFELLSETRVPALVADLRAEGHHAYVNLLGGGSETLDISDPIGPDRVGSHDVADWVRGLYSSHVHGGAMFRKVECGIEVAVPR